MRMSISKSVYHAGEYLWERTPDIIRHQRFVSKIKTIVKDTLLRHNVLYDENYYLQRREQAQRSANIMAEYIVRDLAPADVLDAGCATGDLLGALRSFGVPARGLEYSNAALKICWVQGLTAKRFNLEKDLFSDQDHADVIVSTEVAEHLPESAAEHYVDQLSNAGRWVVFTAAPPGQGGLDHVNEQPRAYWEEKFLRRGFQIDQDLTSAWQRAWEDLPITGHYRNNLMLFRRQSS